MSGDAVPALDSIIRVLITDRSANHGYLHSQICVPEYPPVLAILAIIPRRSPPSRGPSIILPLVTEPSQETEGLD